MEAIVHMLYQEKVRAQMVRGDTARNDYVQMRDDGLLLGGWVGLNPRPIPLGGGVA